MNIKYIDRKTGKLIIERPPAEGMLNFLYNNPIGKLGLLPIVKRKFISEWYGRKMNIPSSAKKIPSFVEELRIDMSESQKTIAEFTSFNDFFYRKLKPDARPIQSGFIAPGDGKLLAFERVSEVNNFFVKGQLFNLHDFLIDKRLAEKYHNASMLILRLAPNDYHRFHFPDAGLPSIERQIRGQYFSVSPYALARNFTRVFCENKRSIVELKSENTGDIALIPVGATMVGSIVMTYRPAAAVDKGEEMGYFAFGGSTIVILVNRDQLQIDRDILVNTQNKIETAVRMGEKIGG